MNPARLGSAIALVAAVLGTTSCASPPPAAKRPAPTGPAETVKVLIPEDGWERDYDIRDPQQTIQLYLPVGSTPTDWTRSVTYLFMRDNTQTPEATAERFRDNLMKQCPQSLWNVLDKTAHSITYEWKIEKCIGQKQQHEFVRLMAGNEGLHRLGYIRQPTIEATERATWLKMLADAYVEKDGKPIR